MSSLPAAVADDLLDESESNLVTKSYLFSRKRSLEFMSEILETGWSPSSGLKALLVFSGPGLLGRMNSSSFVSNSLLRVRTTSSVGRSLSS